MVNWLLENNCGENLDEAIEIGNFFISKNVFHHV